MSRLVIHWVISIAALLFATLLLQPGVQISPLYHVIWLAPLLGLTNMLVGGLTSVFKWFAWPANLLSLGCFGFMLSFILNALVVYGIGTRFNGVFVVNSFWSGLALVIIMAVMSSLLNIMLPGKNKKE